MSKSFASSRLLRRSALGACCLVALTLITTGCGEAKSADYSPDAVEAAFEAAGISLYDPSRPFGRGSAEDGRREPGQDGATGRGERARPLTALLEGARDALLIQSREGERDRTYTELKSRYISVSIYPSVEEAEARAGEYKDILESEVILGDRAQFGYFHEGNIVVDYRVFDVGSRVPDDGRFYTPRGHELLMKQLVTDALARLG